MTTVPLTEAKSKLSELVDDTVRTHQRVTITRHGKPAVVIMAVEDLEAMEETMFWQGQPGLEVDLANGRAEAEADALVDETTVRRRFGVGSAR
jgi:prevent-host-death family protein